MTYNLLNKTDIPKDKIKSLVKFAAPLGLDNFSISILPSKNDYGVFGEAIISKKRIMIWVGNLYYPEYCNDKSLEKYGYVPNFIINNLDEDILSTMAHELRHLWQMTVSKKDFMDCKIFHYTHWDNKKYYSISKMESDACKYSYKIIKKFRNKSKIT